VQQLPEKFKENVRSLLQQEAEHFFASLFNEPATTVRLNPLKPIETFNQYKVVDWCDTARYLPKRPSFVADPLFHAGSYYVQEASSMFIQQAFKYITQNNNTPLKVLDLCAAPGGKTTHIQSLLTDDDLLVANEIIKTRVPVLEENLIKWGRSNMVITNNDSKDFKKLKHYFDVILVDAPCSGEGMFRKDKQAIEEWSEENVQLCTERQQRIIANISEALKPGGYLIYSTCTFNTKENEENVSWMMQQFGLQSIQIPNSNFEGVTSVSQFNNLPLYAYRFYPHKVNSEGFFMACLKKPQDEISIQAIVKIQQQPKLTPALIDAVNYWLNNPASFEITLKETFVLVFPKQLYAQMVYLKSVLNVKLAGLYIGEFIKNKIIPSHQLALSIHLNNSIPKLPTTFIDALKYLRKDTFATPNLVQDIYLITYNNLGIGWAKIMPNRMNNYLPTNWRILKDLNQLINSNENS
jgi:NOL1/NOP2/sun family putative RNA methylase